MSIDARFRDKLNFRDLGTYETNDGRRVKPGYFFRGAGLDFFNENELNEFKKLGIKTIMDIRSSRETSLHPDPIIEDINHIEHSGLENDIDWSPSGMSQVGGEGKQQIDKIINHYQNILLDNKAYQIMMKEIFDDNVPIYFHCAAGKDRTGAAAIILLLALNVKEDEIKKDYFLSNVFLKEILEEKLAKIADRVNDYPELHVLTTILYGVYEDIFDVMMNSIKDRYDNYDDYIIEQFNIDKNQLDAFRDKYLY